MVFAVHFGQIAQLRGSWGPFDLHRFLENGNTGVALFFALSGFLLSRPYWQALQLRSPLPPSGQFFMRRVARIVPAYFFCLTTLIIVNRLWQEDSWPGDALLHYGLVFNFFEANIFSINPPFWTVAIEFQFYLLLPLMFYAFWRLQARTAALMFAALALATYFVHWKLASSLTANLVDGMTLSPVWSYSLLAHFPLFLFGVLSAWYFGTRPFKRWSPSEVIAPGRELVIWLASVVLLVILGTQLDDLLQIPHGRYNLPFVPALMCLLIVLAPLTATGWLLLDNSAMRGIGTVSYGVYLFHLPILHVIARLMPKQGLDPNSNWLAFGLTGLLVTLAIATASYVLLERPIRRWATRWR